MGLSNKIKRISALAVLAAVSTVSCVNSNTENLFEREARIDIPIQQVEINLIGESHDLDKEFKKSLVEKASRGEIVLGLEGIVRDHRSEERHIRDRYNLDKGLNFGIEDDFAYSYVGLLINSFAINVRPTNKRRQMAIEKAKYTMIYLLKNSTSPRKAWDLMSNDNFSPNGRKLYDYISKYLLESGSNAIESMNEFRYNIRDKEAWKEVYFGLCRKMTDMAKELPEDQRPDIEKLENHLRFGLELVYILEDMNNKWREKRFINPVKEIVRIAFKHKKPFYFIVGSFHSDSMKEKLEKEGFIVNAYSSVSKYQNKESKKD